MHESYQNGPFAIFNEVIHAQEGLLSWFQHLKGVSPLDPEVPLPPLTINDFPYRRPCWVLELEFNKVEKVIED